MRQADQHASLLGAAPAPRRCGKARLLRSE
jgi:hypothetical protein